MKKAILLSLSAMAAATVMAKDVKVTSPDGRLAVVITDNGGKAAYSVTYDEKPMLTPSALGLRTNIGDSHRD